MTLSSMTGFAREAGTTGAFQWAWELKSVNGRGLDIRTRLPPGFDVLADEMRGLIQKSFSRGQCQLSLLVSKANVTPHIRVNEEALRALVEVVEKLPVSKAVGKITLDGLLTIRGIVEFDEGDDPTQDPTVLNDLRQAGNRLIDALKGARKSEGKALKDVILKQICYLEKLVDEADKHPCRQPDAIREKLKIQIAQLMDSSTVLDSDRLHQEAVLIATRVDIREELDRLKAHIQAVYQLLDLGEAVGRRLDFLAQEFGRESNTLCAKANDASLSRIGLEIKALVEQFREQVQNVE